MNDPLSRVLLHWGDSRWHWLPFSRLRPPPHEALSPRLPLLHGLSGLLWAGLPFLLVVRWWLGRWSPVAFLVPGAVGGLASLLWSTMIRLAWNRRAAEYRRRSAAGEPPAVPVPWTPLDRWIVQPLLFAGALGLALALVVAAENLRGALKLRAVQAELRAGGAPVTLAELVPPPVPDGRNLALSPLLRPLLDYERVPAGRKSWEGMVQWRDTNGLERVRQMSVETPRSSFRAFSSGQDRKESNWIDGGRIDLELWQAYYRSLPEWPHPPQPGTPARDVLTALGRFDNDLRDLRGAAAERPECRFPIHYEESFGALLPHLAVLKSQVSLLRLRATALLADGQTDAALADIQLAFRLSDGVATEPLLISHLVHLALDALILQPVWEGCLDHRWAEAQLVDLQQALARRDHLGSVRRALDGERILSGLTYDLLASGEVRGTWIVDYDDAGLQLFLRYMPRGWIRQGQVAHIRFLRALDQDLATAASHAALTPGEQWFERFIDKRSLFHLIPSMLAPAVGKASDRTFQGEAWRRLALVGLALERHRLAQGRYPETLDALAPRYLPQVPADPMDAKPLRYAVVPNGPGNDYHLHSVGLDHRDDAGRRLERQGRRGTVDAAQTYDLVWR